MIVTSGQFRSQATREREEDADITMEDNIQLPSLSPEIEACLKSDKCALVMRPLMAQLQGYVTRQNFSTRQSWQVFGRKLFAKYPNLAGTVQDTMGDGRSRKRAQPWSPLTDVLSRKLRMRRFHKKNNFERGQKGASPVRGDNQSNIIIQEEEEEVVDEEEVANEDNGTQNSRQTVDMSEVNAKLDSMCKELEKETPDDTIIYNILEATFEGRMSLHREPQSQLGDNRLTFSTLQLVPCLDKDKYVSVYADNIL